MDDEGVNGEADPLNDEDDEDGAIEDDSDRKVHHLPQKVDELLDEPKNPPVKKDLLE